MSETKTLLLQNYSTLTRISEDYLNSYSCFTKQLLNVIIGQKRNSFYVSRVIVAEMIADEIDIEEYYNEIMLPVEEVVVVVMIFVAMCV